MSPDQVSSISSLGVVFILLMGALLILLPRRLALLPIAMTTCYMTFGEQLIIGGLHFTMLRMLVLMGCARLVLRNDLRKFKWLQMDTLMLLWILASIVTYTLLWQTSEALINRLGLAYDAAGFYFVFRCLVRDVEDVKRYCRVFALVLFPLAVCMCIEKATGRNPFAVFGGVPEITVIREGTLRCQGPFGHPILAGTFGAVWLPMFVGLWWQRKNHRAVAAIGIVASTLITVLSGSSGPVAVYLGAIVALGMWFARKRMAMVRWGILAALLLLQAVMKAPIWFVFAHLNIFSGSTGWHRANLIDRTVGHFWDWWLVGTKDTISWGVWAGDITNQFISQAVRGGLVTLVLFICIIVLAYSRLGKTMQRAKKSSRHAHLLLWAIGSTLFAHIVGFFNVSYFDQNIVNWYLLLATVATVEIAYGSDRQMQKRTTSQVELVTAGVGSECAVPQPAQSL